MVDYDWRVYYKVLGDGAVDVMSSVTYSDAGGLKLNLSGAKSVNTLSIEPLCAKAFVSFGQH